MCKLWLSSDNDNFVISLEMYDSSTFEKKWTIIYSYESRTFSELIGNIIYVHESFYCKI